MGSFDAARMPGGLGSGMADGFACGMAGGLAAVAAWHVRCLLVAPRTPPLFAHRVCCHPLPSTPALPAACAGALLSTDCLSVAGMQWA